MRGDREQRWKAIPKKAGEVGRSGPGRGGLKYPANMIYFFFLKIKPSSNFKEWLAPAVLFGRITSEISFMSLLETHFCQLQAGK